MSEELKPCPFCGGKLDETYQTIKCCSGCHAQFECSNELWNTRHNPIIEELEGLVSDYDSQYCDHCCDYKLESIVEDLTNLINKHKEGGE